MVDYDPKTCEGEEIRSYKYVMKEGREGERRRQRLRKREKEERRERDEGYYYITDQIT